MMNTQTHRPQLDNRAIEHIQVREDRSGAVRDSGRPHYRNAAVRALLCLLFVMAIAWTAHGQTDTRKVTITLMRWPYT